MVNLAPRGLWVILLALVLGACDGSPPVIDADALNTTVSGRGEASLNSGWLFRKGDDRARVELESLDDGWASVSLPHTWNTEDGADGGDDYYRGEGWYHRALVVAPELDGRRFFLHFNAANLVTDVYLNGRHLGRHAGGYSAFRFDISDELTLGETNVLSVKVNNARNDDIPPLAADFTFYGGIYRPVSLIVTQPLHIEMMDYASPGVFIDQRDVSAGNATLDIRSTLVNEGGEPRQAEVEFDLTDREGVSVASVTVPVTVPPGGKLPVAAGLSLERPRLWQGRAAPYLYSLSVRVLDGGKVVDSVSQPVGLRQFTIDPTQGAYLNGTPIRLNGVSRHQDRKGKGWALTDDDHRQDFELIADMGATAVRLAHYQHAETVYDLTDEMGFLVWAEVPVISEVNGSPGFTASAEQQLTELIRQNYNHPSIVMWGLFNEISIHASEANARLVNKLQALARREDPNRLTTGAVLGNHEKEAVWSIPDVIAQNRYDGWYYNGFDGMDAWLGRVRVDYPARAVGISEYGAGASVDIHSMSPKNQDHSEEYQNLYHEANWLIMREHPAMWGSFIWNMFDFAADLRDEGSVPGLNNKGMVSFDRTVRKDAYYWYRSHWNHEPMVYITSRRFDVRKTPATSIKVYSNRPAVTLLVNGKPLGSVANDGSNRFIWTDVPLAMGDNTVKAEAGELVDEVSWQRVLNDDNSLAAEGLGVDNINHIIFNLPYGLSRPELESVLSLPYGASLAWAAGVDESGQVLDDDRLSVVAANGDTQVYSFARGALSLGRPVKASRELSHGMMGSPPALATNVVDGNANIHGDSGEDAFWVTADPNQGPGWLKIDLGARYYLDRLEAAWLPAHINEQGVMKYTIDIADEMADSAVVFAETYREVVDRRANTTPLQTSDHIGAVARYVKVNVLDSSYTFDVPILGNFKLIGATEFSVYGGLVYSATLPIDYAGHTIALPEAPALTVGSLLARLSTASADDSLEIRAGGEVLPEDSRLPPGAWLLATSNANGIVRRERYELRASQPAPGRPASE